MAALQFVIRNIELEEKLDHSELLENLDELNRELDNYLENKNNSFFK